MNDNLMGEANGLFGSYVDRIVEYEVNKRTEELRTENERLQKDLDELRSLADVIVDRQIEIIKGGDTIVLESMQRQDEWYLVQLAHTLGENK